MRQRSITGLDGILAVMVVAAVPVGIFHASSGRFAQAIIALGSAAVGSYLLAREWQSAAPQPGPEITEGGLAFGAGEIRAIGIQGECPLMYRMGEMWKVEAGGHLDFPLCSPALEAVQPLLDGLPATVGQTARCSCPVGGDRSILFTTRPLREMAQAPA